MMRTDIRIKELKPEETGRALELVHRVFMTYEAPDYTREGTEEFEKSIRDEAYLSQLRFFGAFLKEELVGVLATRSGGTHIALFFVEGQYHRQGIGTRLFHAALAHDPADTMTVNSSPYAVPVYHHLGFRDTDAEQTVNGLRFTPMELRMKRVEPHDKEITP